MCEGEFESLKAVYAASPGFVPKPYAWGKYTQRDAETYFLLAEFRDVGKQVRPLRFVGSRYIHGILCLARPLFLLSTASLKSITYLLPELTQILIFISWSQD